MGHTGASVDAGIGFSDGGLLTGMGFKVLRYDDSLISEYGNVTLLENNKTEQFVIKCQQTSVYINRQKTEVTPVHIIKAITCMYNTVTQKC